MTANFAALAYLLASVLFIMALRGLSSPETARSGNSFAITGMIIAIVTTVALPGVFSYVEILGALVVGGAIGTVIALRIQMAAMPQLVAAFHSLVGLAAVLVAAAAFYNPAAYGIVDASGVLKVASRIEMSLGIVIGAITFSGSIIAFTKLQGLVSGNPVVFPGQHLLNLVIGLVIVALIVAFAIDVDPRWFWLMTGLAFLIGFLIIIPIGGADMPVVIALLNSYSGLAACAAGFVLNNNILIVAGSLVGASGMILTNIMCKAMNRSLGNVLFSGFGAVSQQSEAVEGEVKPVVASDAYLILEAASSVAIVPGYGMAVAQAQHAVQELAVLLEENGCEVKFAVHPVAGRMPGHMNVLLAEANVPYDQLVEMEDINPQMGGIDVTVVIGANDVVNPAALDTESSPIYGMPIIHVHESGTVIVLKRSMATGFAGLDNALFYGDNTRMLFGDAKESVMAMVAEFKS